MGRLSRPLVLALIVSLLPVYSVAAQNLQDFHFDSFDAQYYLVKDENNISSMRVVETLVAQFPDFDQNHGILRSLPEVYGQYDLSLSIDSVTDGEVDRPFTTYSENDNLVLKIGDPDKYVRGEQTYVIGYTVKNVITFYENSNELFWDVNGTDWLQPFGLVTATIHIDGDIGNNLFDETLCFVGSYGLTGDDCSVEINRGETSVEASVSAANLEIYENLSFVLGFSSGTFTEDPWPATRKNINIVLVILLPMVGIIAAYGKWRKYGKDPEGKGVIAQYSPPKGLNAIAAKALIDEKFSPDSISAGIIEMAISGYIRVHEIKKGKLRKKSEYELELIQNVQKLDEEQRVLIEALFRDQDKVGEKVNLSKNKYKLYEASADINKVVMSKLVREGYFKEKPSKVIGKQMIFGVIIVLIGIVVLALANKVWGLGVGVIAVGTVAMIFSVFMPVKTLKGVEAKEYILGLKDYIDLAEKDRINFHQSPEGARQYPAPKNDKDSVNLFETLLPFAMIFGMEKKWAKQFQDLYNEPPDWFYGRTLAPAMLANSISKMQTTSRNAFSAPSSSGSSGFGGGGFSGGGGGGGGGGGW